MGTQHLLLLLGGPGHLNGSIQRSMASSRGSRAFGSWNRRLERLVFLSPAATIGHMPPKWMMSVHYTPTAASIQTHVNIPHCCWYWCPDRRRWNRLIIGLNWPERMGFGRDAASEVGDKLCVAPNSVRVALMSLSNAHDSLACSHVGLIVQNCIQSHCTGQALRRTSYRTRKSSHSSISWTKQNKSRASAGIEFAS